MVLINLLEVIAKHNSINIIKALIIVHSHRNCLFDCIMVHFINTTVIPIEVRFD